MTSSGGERLLALDHLRALAALLVLYWHGLHQLSIPYAYVAGNWLSSFIEEGWVGVSLFMAITGFMFTVLTTGRQINYLPFLLNRFLRIFPLLFLVTLFGAYFTNASRDLMFLFFNLLGGGAVFGTWSLIVEWQFYLAYPFIRDKLVHTQGSHVIWWQTLLSCLALILLFTALRTTYYFKENQAQAIAYWTIFGRGDEFIGGIIAGLIYLRIRDHALHWWRWGALVGVTAALLWVNYRFAVTGGYYNRPKYPSPSLIWIFWPTVTAFIWSSFILAYCMAFRWASGRLSKALAYVGAISYSTYMLHFLTVPMATGLARRIGLTLPIEDPFTNAAVFLTVWHYPITIVFSIISYELIEKAFLTRRRPYLGPRAPMEEPAPEAMPSWAWGQRRPVPTQAATAEPVAQLRLPTGTGR